MPSTQAARLDEFREVEAKIRSERAAGREFRDQLLATMGQGDEPDWSGLYCWGNGFETHTLVLCSAGFYFDYSHCTGMSTLAYGEVEKVDGPAVHLAPELWLDVPEVLPSGGSARRRFRFDDELLVVPWDHLRFIVPVDLMPEFCELIHAEGWDAMRYAEYPYVVNDGHYASLWKLAETLDGVPEVPQEYLRFLPN